MRAGLRMLTFAVVGPPVGAFVFFFGIGLYTSITSGKYENLVVGITQVFLSPGILLFTYFIGIVPALVTGMIAAIIGGRVPGAWQYVLWVALTGIVTSLVATSWFTLPHLFRQEPEGLVSSLVFLFVIALTGAAAAIVSALVFDGLAALMKRRVA